MLDLFRGELVTLNPSNYFILIKRCTVIFLIALFSACKSDPSTTTDGALPTPSIPSTPPATGQIQMDSCIGLSGVNERCTLITNASACTTNKCRKLVVIFSGGEMGCISGAGYQNALNTYATNGYAAVCINYFDTPVGSGDVPYVDEASRIDTAVKEATTGAWASAYWTGEHLLLQGISHGATAPVILMARTNLASQTHWHGSLYTGGCFFDGSYNQIATANLLKTGAIGGNPCTSPVSYTRGLERYCGPGATTATCQLSTNAKAIEDTITNLSISFSIHDFKMFECGSAGPTCTKDIIPGVPIQDLCSTINSTTGYSCDFVSLPNDGHLTCHANEFNQCRIWFENKIPPG